MDTFESNLARVNPTDGGREQQVRDLKRLCFKHWLYLMLASLMDAPSPESGIDQLGSTRMDVMQAAGRALSAGHVTCWTCLRPPRRRPVWKTPGQPAGRIHRRHTNSPTNGHNAAGSCPFAG